MKNNRTAEVSVCLRVRGIVALLCALAMCVPQTGWGLAPPSRTNDLLEVLAQRANKERAPSKERLGNMFFDFLHRHGAPQDIMGRHRHELGWLDEYEHAFFYNQMLYVPVLDDGGARYLRVRQEPALVQTGQLRFDFSRGLHPDLVFEEVHTHLADAGVKGTWNRIAKEQLNNGRIEAARAAMLFGHDSDYDTIADFFYRFLRQSSPARSDINLLREAALLLMASETFGKSRQVDRVLNLLETHRRFDSPSMRSYIQRMQEGNADGAKGALKISPRHPDYGIFTGYAYIRRLNWDAAQREFLGSLRADAGNVHTWRLLALTLERQGQTGKARWIRGLIAKGHSLFTQAIVERVARSLEGIDVFQAGGALDQTQGVYDNEQDVYVFTDPSGSINVAERLPDATFAMHGGTAARPLAQRIRERDEKIQTELATLQDVSLPRTERLNATPFVARYFLPRSKNHERLGEIVRALGEELKDLEKVHKEEEFLEQLEILSKLPSRQAIDEMVAFVVQGEPDTYRAYATRTLANCFQQGWDRGFFESRNPLLGKTNVAALVDYMQGLLSDEAIAAAAADETEGKVLLYNLTKLWEVVRSPSMIDFFMHTLEHSRWPYATALAGEALKNAWVLHQGSHRQNFPQWIAALKRMALNPRGGMIKRSLAIGALAGVKEEALGVAALQDILREFLRDPENTRFLRLKVLEAISMYAKRGDLSTLSLTGKIDTEPLILFLDQVMKTLEGAEFPPTPQIGVGVLLPGEKAPTLNILNAAELYGSLLSLLIRDDRTQGGRWDTLQPRMQKIHAQVLSASRGAGIFPVVVVSEGAVEVSNIRRILAQREQAQEEAQKKVDRLFARKGVPQPMHVESEHRNKGFPLFEYYGVTSTFARKLLEEYDLREAFLWGLYVDLPLVTMEHSAFARQAAGGELVAALRADLGDLYGPIHEIEEVIQRVLEAEEDYGLGTEAAIMQGFTTLRSIDRKWFESHPHALTLWQRQLFHLAYTVQLDKFGVDSPANRRYARIKLLHSTEVIPQAAYRIEYKGTAAVTVDDRWMIYPSDIYKFAKNYGWDVTRSMHEAQHWLGGNDDIAMLGAAVTYGFLYELNALYFRRHRMGSVKPIEEVLQKIVAKQPLERFEDTLVTDEFREGLALAYDEGTRGPKTGILRAFHHFERPVNDWSWEEVVAARRQIFVEQVTAHTVTGKEYVDTDTYQEGGKLAGYLMGVSARFGVLEAWPVFAELLAKRPEKYFGSVRGAQKYTGVKLRQLHPAEIFLVVNVMGELGRDVEYARELAELSRSVEEEVTRRLKLSKVATEPAGLLQRRVAKKIEDRIRETVLAILLSAGEGEAALGEDASYEDIDREARRLMGSMREAARTESMFKSIVGSVTWDISNRLTRPVPVLSPLWMRFEHARQPVAASL